MVTDDDITRVSAVLAQRRSAVERLIGVRDELVGRQEKLNAELVGWRTEGDRLRQALSFVEGSVRQTRQDVVHDVETVVNEALRAVYGDEAPRLELELSVKRDRTAIVPYLVQRLPDGTEVRRLSEGAGGGVGDVVAVVLRLVLIRATTTDPVLIADEPFKFLGNLQPAAAALLRVLAERLGVQVIMTTHDDSTVEAAHAAFKLELDDARRVCVTEEKR